MLDRPNSQTIRLVPEAPRDPDAFLRWAAGREGRYELSRGEVTEMMVRTTRDHARIAARLVFELMSALEGRGFHVSTADFGVRTPHGVRYPDVLVDPDSSDGKELASSHPILLAEILSPSSLEIDFVQKAAEYKAIASLRTYLILSQDEPRVWAWHRGEEGWPEAAAMVEGADGIVGVPALGVGLKLGRIYREGGAR